MAVNATLWAAGLEAAIRPDGNISFVGPYAADDVCLRRLRQGDEAVGHGGLGLADSEGRPEVNHYHEDLDDHELAKDHDGPRRAWRNSDQRHRTRGAR